MAVKAWIVSLPAELAEAVQRVATEQPEEFVLEAVKRELERRNQLTAIREGTGAWSGHDEIPGTVEGLIEFMRRMRASEERDFR